jgi:GNAT superfamily N-acetyltransferase
MTGTGDFVPPPLTRLAEGHKLDAFDSGEPPLDAWLRDHALRLARRRLSATHVWEGQGGSVLAYATLASGVIARQDLTRSIGHGYPDTIPVVLLARLALHRDLQGQNLGSVLLTEALGIAASSSINVAAAFVVVDALHDKAASFYLHHGFSRLPDTTRLALKMSTIAAA